MKTILFFLFLFLAATNSYAQQTNYGTNVNLGTNRQAEHILINTQAGMDWKSLLIGVAGSILAAVIITMIARARGWVQFAWRSWSKNRELLQRLEAAGIVNFYASRDDYVKYRGTPRLLDYLSTGQKTIHIASHWLAHGAEMEGIIDGLADLVRPPKKLTIVVGITDPNSPYVGSLAAFFNIEEQDLVNRIRSAFTKLLRLA